MMINLAQMLFLVCMGARGRVGEWVHELTLWCCWYKLTFQYFLTKTLAAFSQHSISITNP